MKHNTPQTAKFRRFVRMMRDLVACSNITMETVCVGILERLWHATIISAPQGDIGKLQNEDIAEIVGWHGDADDLINILIDCRWLDPCDDNRLIVHDWAEHCPLFVKGCLARHGKDFALASDSLLKPSLTKPNLTSGEAPKQAPKQSAKQKANKLSVSFDPLKVEFPETLMNQKFQTVWKDWVGHRKQIENPLTEYSTRLQIKQFEEWGIARSIAAIEHTIRNGWVGIREPDSRKGHAETEIDTARRL